VITRREDSKRFGAGAIVALVLHVGIIGFVLNMVRPDLIPQILPKKKVVVVEMLKPPDPPKPKEPPKEPPKQPPKPQPTPKTPPPPQQLQSNAPANVDVPTAPPAPPPSPPSPPAPLEPPAPTRVITGGVPTEYYNTLNRVINGAVQYPPKSLRAGEEGTAKIRFHVTRDGTIKDVELIEKSGFVSLDSEAKDAFRRLGKFPPVPPNVVPDAAEFILEIPINFTLTGSE